MTRRPPRSPLFPYTTLFRSPGPPLHVGTGPFVLKEWVRGSHAVLERNPNYWDKPKPYLDRMIIRFMPDAAGRSAAFEAGDLDLGGPSPVPPAHIDRFHAAQHLPVVTPRFASFRQPN